MKTVKRIIFHNPRFHKIKFYIFNFLEIKNGENEKLKWVKKAIFRLKKGFYKLGNLEVIKTRLNFVLSINNSSI
jgi:hypothetical protein